MDLVCCFLLCVGFLLLVVVVFFLLLVMVVMCYVVFMQIFVMIVVLDVLVCDENYWVIVVSYFDVIDEVNYLENGYWGVMGCEMLVSYQCYIVEVNCGNVWYGCCEFLVQYMVVQWQVVELLGVGVDEIVLIRGVIEVMLVLIGGYNCLQFGDQVLYVDIDYDSMIGVMCWLQWCRGVQVECIVLLVVFDYVQIFQVYEVVFVWLLCL